MFFVVSCVAPCNRIHASIISNKKYVHCHKTYISTCVNDHKGITSSTLNLVATNAVRQQLGEPHAVVRRLVVHGNISDWWKTWKQVRDDIDTGTWLLDRGDLARRWCEAVESVASQGRVPDVAVAVNGVLDWGGEESWVVESLHVTTVHVDAADGVACNGCEPKVSSLSLGTHDSRGEEIKWKWVLDEGPVGGVEASDLVLFDCQHAKRRCERGRDGLTARNSQNQTPPSDPVMIPKGPARGVGTVQFWTSLVS